MPTFTRLPPSETIDLRATAAVVGTKAALIAGPSTPVPKFTETPTLIAIPSVTSDNTKTPYSGKDGAPMVLIPAGEFQMGSTSRDTQAQQDEKPLHHVFLDAFWIDKFEVTNSLYKKCVNDGRCSPLPALRSQTRLSYYDDQKYENYPVVYVSWFDAAGYCESIGKHLPTEAQWEKAARGTDGRIFPWGDQPDASKANFSNLGEDGDTSSVDRFPAGASPYGVMDMAGNVWEWVRDWFDGGYYQNSPYFNPLGIDVGRNEQRVARGGAWNSTAAQVRTAFRYPRVNTYNAPDLGFRCVSPIIK